MCGIVGIAAAYQNGLTVPEADAFFDMLYFDALRGMDSTGVFAVDKNSNVVLHKEASAAGDFIRTKELNDFRRHIINKGFFVVGHNRSATRGKVVDENAHPFVVDDKIVLVQNGTYKGDHKVHKDTEVDTEAVAHVLAENEDIEAALKKVNAAYAFTWFNTATKTLYMIRNDERPLYLVNTEQGALIWCSEPGFIQLACARANLKLKDKPKLLGKHELVSLRIDNGRWIQEHKKLECEYKYPLYVPPSIQGYPFRGPMAESNDEVGEHFRQNNLIPLGWKRPQAATCRHVEKPVAEILIDKFPDFHMSPEEAVDITRKISRLRASPNFSPTMLVELHDYEPVNDRADCDMYHVWGMFHDARMDFGEKVVAHWFVEGVTEQQIIDYVADTWYNADLCSSRSLTQNDKKSVVTCFMSNVKPALEAKVTELVH